MAMMMPMALKTEPRLGREIGERLEALRQAHGWTQGQLVIKTNLDKSTVYQILAGARKDPPVGTVKKFAEAFGIGVDELIGLKPLQIPEVQKPAAETDRLAKLEAQVEALSALPGQLQAMAESMADLLESQSSVRKQKRSGADARRSA